MSESKLQSDCKKMADDYRILTRKVHAEGHRGWPDYDLIFPFTGLTVRVEMKNPNKKGRVSRLQREEHDAIREQGAFVYKCDSKHDFFEIIKRHLKDKKFRYVFNREDCEYVLTK